MKRDRIYFDSGYIGSLKNVKRQYSEVSRLLWAEQLKNSIQKSIDSLNYQDQDVDISAIIPSGGQGSITFSTFNARQMDVDEIIFFEVKKPIGQYVLDFDSLSTKNFLRAIPEGQVLMIDDLEAKFFGLSSKLGNHYSLLECGGLRVHGLHELSHLLVEFHDLINYVVEDTKRSFEIVFRRRLSNYRTDRRRYIRRVSHFLYKCLPDFSGCDEEAVSKTPLGLKQHSLLLQSKISCTIQLHCLAPLIHSLSPLRAA